jgi:phospholipid/cholesterol/gamma-HCH transport system permease protein
LTDQPELTASDGERATLRPSGAWTVANVEVIEGLCESALPAQVGAIDLSRVTALDTVGAWLFEKLVRRFSTPSAKTSLVGVSESYAGLMQEILGVNRGQPAARRRDGFLLDFLERIGRALAAESAAFLQMLGAVGIALLGVLRRPLLAADIDSLSALQGGLAGDPDHGR